MIMTPWEGKHQYEFVHHLFTHSHSHTMYHSSGIDVYVLDTGVYAEHLDFGGRASHSANMIKHEDNTDMGGHGNYHKGKNHFGVLKRTILI